MLLDDETPNAGVRRAVFNLMSKNDLAEAMAQIDTLARPADDQYFKELRAQHRRLRFLPSMLRAVSFGAAPAGKPILEAIEAMRSVVDEKRRPGTLPTDFVPESWMRQVRDEAGTIDLTGYRLCLLDRMRAAIRRRDLYVAPSFRTPIPERACWMVPRGNQRVRPCAAPWACRARPTRN